MKMDRKFYKNVEMERETTSFLVFAGLIPCRLKQNKPTFRYSVYRAIRRIFITFKQQMHKVFVNTLLFLTTPTCFDT